MASGIGALMSAISEYGFDVDFPLTPSLWLVVAVFTFFAATAHAAIGSRIHSIEKRETGTYLSAHVPSPSDSASSISDRCPNICQNNFDVSGRCHEQTNSGGVIGTVRDMIPAIIYLSPTATRGPPSNNNQIDCTLGRPARHVYTALLPSVHLYDSSSARNTSMNGTGQTPIRSAIEGDQT